jgi:hypothetical protein
MGKAAPSIAIIIKGVKPIGYDEAKNELILKVFTDYKELDKDFIAQIENVFDKDYRMVEEVIHFIEKLQIMKVLKEKIVVQGPSQD